ncbi:MASE1 domain-containing protein [Streptomyces sp. ICBB 8177]|uniref:MASE1 domain-containing protein n=1 Tax=Streptomyces sp. ICBB 8177 TaxID=563922 RepID=UPI000D676F77|nr:MASE1 domain-containing protein [Streptomyces sp. ICBB 8177]PWI42872.1 hypothetical protein CK485_11445 [Streptomyces sp. ICBB 8177]
MGRPGIRRGALALARVLAVAAVYYGAGRLGLLRQVVLEGTRVTPLWPPTGIAVVCLLFLGPAVWPGIALGTLAVTASLSPLDLADIGVIVGNTMAPVCACLLLRWAGFRTELDRLWDGVALVFLGALAPMTVSATLGTVSLLLDGALPGSGYWAAWSAWWAGDAMGVLVVAPVLLALAKARVPSGVPISRWAEAAVLAVCAVVVVLVATRSSLALLFLPFPVLIWAALRFQLSGAAPCTLLLSVAAIVAATDHTGPFDHHGLASTMVNLQALNGSAALTGLLLSAIVTEQRAVRHRIEEACQELAEVVDRLAPGTATPRIPPVGADRRRRGS